MNPADFDDLDESEKTHFYKCEQCGQMVDMRQLDDVLFHEDHVHRPDIQCGGSERLD
jgi:beta-galactosidase beta subunit